MSETTKRPLKVFGECYPNNIWYEQWENGTYYKSRNYFLLWQIESKFEKGIEIVTEMSASNHTHPVVNLILFQFAVLEIKSEKELLTKFVFYLYNLYSYLQNKHK